MTDAKGLLLARFPGWLCCSRLRLRERKAVVIPRECAILQNGGSAQEGSTALTRPKACSREKNQNMWRIERLNLT